MLKLTDYEIVNHGIENSQYFQGCDTHGTSYDHCVTGCGDTAAEALEDAIDQIIMSFDDFDVDSLDVIEPIEGSESVLDVIINDPDYEDGDCMDIEAFYYVSIRFNVK